MMDANRENTMRNDIRQSAPLASDRVGSVVCWSAHAVSVDARTLRAAVLDARRSFVCPTCGAADGDDCVDGFASPLDRERLHETRAGVLAGVVHDPVEPSVAMTRSIARQRKSADGLSWRRGTPDKAAKHLVPVVLVGDERVDGTTTTGDAVSRARWTLIHDERTGGVIVPAGLDDIEQDAVDDLIERYDLERSALTAQDVSSILIGVLVDLGGFSLNGGGTYFVPRDGDEIVERLRLRDVFGAAGYRLSVLDVLAGRADNVRDAAEESLLKDAQEIATAATAASEKMAAFMANTGKGKPQARAVFERLEEIEALRRRGRALARVLGAATASMDAALAAAETSTRRVLDDLSLVG
jgi:hypothetical protein